MNFLISVSLLLILLLRLNEAAESPDCQEKEQEQEEIAGLIQHENISPLTSVSSSPDVRHDLPNFHLLPSAHVEDESEDGRPRKSSFHSHSSPKKSLHVSFGWVQYDDRWMPSDHMEDTEENREHIKQLMLTDARHGNLEYFVYLVNVLSKFDSPGMVSSEDGHELDVNNKKSMMVAAALSDNVDLFIEVMKFKGITLADLNPCKVKGTGAKAADRKLAHSYPQRRRSFFDSGSSSDSEKEEDERISCIQIDETIFGLAILHNSIGILEYLLDHGIKDEYPEKCTTALHYAIKSHHELAIRMLLIRGDSQIDRFDGAFNTPLMNAVLTGAPKLVRLILKFHPDLLVTNFNRCNVLHLAAKVGNLDILRMIKAEADRVIKTKYEYDEFVYGRDLRSNLIWNYAANELVEQFLIENFGLVDKRRMKAASIS